MVHTPHSVQRLSHQLQAAPLLLLMAFQELRCEIGAVKCIEGNSTGMLSLRGPLRPEGDQILWSPKLDQIPESPILGPRILPPTACVRFIPIFFCQLLPLRCPTPSFFSLVTRASSASPSRQAPLHPNAHGSLRSSWSFFTSSSPQVTLVVSDTR